MELIKADEFGIEAQKAQQLTKGLNPILAERDILEQEYLEKSNLEITSENIPIFQDLRLRIMKNRTQGINKWHKTNKEYFLSGGRFIDAIKNKEIAVNQEMEEKLLNAEKHFEILEKKRIEAIQTQRANILSEFVEDAHERNLANMPEDVWDAYLFTKKKQYLDRIEEEKRQEEERIKKQEEEKLEQLRIKKENEILRLEAIKAKEKREKEMEILKKKSSEEQKIREEKEKILKEKLEKVRRDQLGKEEKLRQKFKLEQRKREEELRKEREKREKLLQELADKKRIEEQRLANIEAEKQKELNKNDSQKVHDLIEDLCVLTTKYTFTSFANKSMYAKVCILINKIISFIKKKINNMPIKFTRKINTICPTDERRPSMNGVYFKDGYLYASNGYILIRQSLDLYGFIEEDKTLIDGNWIHKDVFKNLLTYEYLEIILEGIKATNKKGTVQVVFSFGDLKDIGRYPDAESVIPKNIDKIENTPNISSFNPKLFTTLCNVMINQEVISLKIIDNRALIKSNRCTWEEEVGVIMMAR